MPSISGSKEANISRDSEGDLAISSFRRVTKYQNGQIVALTLAFIFSTASCLTLGYVNFILTPGCLLFSVWSGVETRIKNEPRIDRFSSSSTTNETRSTTNQDTLLEAPWRIHFGPSDSSDKLIFDLNILESKWGEKRHCYFTQYGFAAAAVASFILCWFFVFFRPTREAYFLKKKTAASKLIVPALIFCLAFVVCVFVATITLQMGVASWCESITNLLSRCSSIRNYELVWAGKTTEVDFYSILVAAQLLSWISSVAWLANLITLAKRFYHHVDFPNYFFGPFSAIHDHQVPSETDSD